MSMETGFDPDPSVGAFDLDLNDRVAVIRTSDRISFRNCRRKWNWQSGMKMAREPKSEASPLWLGTGIHYAMEDFFGFKKFPTAVDAFKAYVKAKSTYQLRETPIEWQELRDLGIGMLDYFENSWITNRDPFKTYVVDGIPQVEVNFLAEVPFPLAKFGYDKRWDRVVYSGTIDRVIIDEHDRLWLVDYKTAKQLRQSHLGNDPQVSAYCWAASKLYDLPVAGMWYWQLLKDIPSPPEPLKRGGISVAQNQRTTRPLYRQALINVYGSVEQAPPENIEYLNNLMFREGEHYDAFVRRDPLRRNQAQQEAEGAKIMMELEDMLNPDLPLYPNPTFLCGAMCPFFEPCVSLDDGSEWEEQLMAETQPALGKDDSWRKLVELPQTNQFNLPPSPPNQP